MWVGLSRASTASNATGCGSPGHGRPADLARHPDGALPAAAAGRRQGGGRRPGGGGHNGPMTVIRINAITVPSDGGAELARRFAARAGAVDSADGFEGFELLRPTDGRDVWLVVTRWRDEAAFQAWVSSPAFAHGHRGDGATGAEEGAGHPGGHPGSGHPGAGQPGGKPRPVGTHSELWSYDVELAAPGADAG